MYCKRTTYTKSQYCEGMKSRKVQEIPGRSGRKGMEAEKCRKYPRHS